MIEIEDLFQAAHDLIDPAGESPEYERGIVELIKMVGSGLTYREIVVGIATAHKLDRKPGETDEQWWERLSKICPECTADEGDRRDPEMLAERIATRDDG